MGYGTLRTWFRYLPSDATRPPACLISTIQHRNSGDVVGDNGSGKSTLAQLMAGWYRIIFPVILTARACCWRPYRAAPAGRTVAHHPVGAAIALFTAFGCTFSVEGGVLAGISASMKRKFWRIDEGADPDKLPVVTPSPSRHALRRRNAAGGNCQRACHAARLLILDEAFSRLTSGGHRDAAGTAGSGRWNVILSLCF